MKTDVESSPRFEQRGLFISGYGGYHTYRIPALVVSNRGTILAFCEGRKYSSDDAGQIDILLKRSFDYGKSWQDTQVIVAQEGMTCGNPCPVVEGTRGRILLLFCKNLAQIGEPLICEGKGPRTVWLTSSSDEGDTWKKPVEITEQVKDNSWTWYATGPGHGIQLKTGRLVIPCDHVAGKSRNLEEAAHSHVIYSDDHGVDWKIGGIVERGTNESCIAETQNGSLYINCRNYRGAKRRAYAWSYDCGQTFGDLGWDEVLVEPICQASLIRFTREDPTGLKVILFSNPASTEREKMTVRASFDGCKTWRVSKLLYGGPSAYSDLGVGADMKILCLYERGVKHPYERLTLALFDIEWLIR